MNNYLKSSLLVAMGFVAGIIYLMSCGGHSGPSSVTAQQSTLAPEFDPAKIIGGTFDLNVTNDLGFVNPTLVTCPAGTVTTIQLSPFLMRKTGSPDACFDLGAGPIVLLNYTPTDLSSSAMVRVSFWAGPNIDTVRTFIDSTCVGYEQGISNSTFAVCTTIHPRLYVKAGEHLYARITASGSLSIAAVQWSGYTL